MAMPAFSLKRFREPIGRTARTEAMSHGAVSPRAIEPPDHHPATGLPAVATGPLARPGRVVMGWMVAVALVVAGSTAYLSLLVHMAMMGRYAAELERQLAMERRRGEALEVALARETSPASTEAKARVLLAMDRPKQVRLVVLDKPAGQSLARADAAGSGAASAGSGVGSASVAGVRGTRAVAAQAERERHWLPRLGAMVAGLAGKPIALARQLPSWP